MRSRKVDAQRKRIEQQRDQLLKEIEALRNKVAGLEMALSLLGADSEEANGGAPKVKGSLRQILTELLREAGTTGLNANSAVETAARRGLHLDRQSVASTLSRMKSDSLVEYDGERYRLASFSGSESVVRFQTVK